LKGQIQPRLFTQGNNSAFIFALYQHLFVVFTGKSTGTQPQFEIALTICNAIATAFLVVRNKPPATIDDATTLFYTLIVQEYGYTGNTKHYVGGELIGEVPALAICQYGSGKGYYLFRCDEHWIVITDTFHVSIEEAMGQAEYEYVGLTAEKWKQYKIL
jgi:hypothetical protein